MGDGLTGALVGGVTGMVVALVIGLVRKARGKAPTRSGSAVTYLAAILVAAVAVGGYEYYRFTAGPAIADDPELDVLQKYYPQQYAQILPMIQSASSELDVHNEVSPIISQIVATHRAQMDDDSARLSFKLIVEETSALMPQHPADCMALLNAGPLDTPLSQILPASVMNDDETITVSVLTQMATAPAAPAAPLPADEQQKLAMAALNALPPDEKATATSVLQGSGQPSGDAQDAAMCDYDIALFKTLEAQPPATMRAFMARS